MVRRCSTTPSTIKNAYRPPHALLTTTSSSAGGTLAGRVLPYQRASRASTRFFTATASERGRGLEERLKSRFGWGLTVAIEPPELETCVAILIGKAQAMGVELPEEVAFFIAKCSRSNGMLNSAM
jgi:hypothetical protein